MVLSLETAQLKPLHSLVNRALDQIAANQFNFLPNPYYSANASPINHKNHCRQPVPCLDRVLRTRARARARTKIRIRTKAKNGIGTRNHLG